jgi:penicillin amidase
MPARQTAGGSGSGGARPRFVRVALVVFCGVVCTVVVGLLVVRQVLVASLPLTTGSRTLRGLTASVRVDRDARGVPTIRGTNRLDVARATGFVHAQERFFQMDVARRFAAGELSELVGAATVATDKRNRLHRLRAVARDVLARSSSGERALLEAYTGGVNAGLDALGARPPEYLLLRSQPAPWRPEDSILVVGAMFANDLENSARECELGDMYARLPAALVDFLRPLGDEWDAPLVGDPIVTPPIPGPEVFTLRGPRTTPAKDVSTPALSEGTGLEPCAPVRPGEHVEAAWTTGTGQAGIGEALCATDSAGSNAWAIAGSHTADGHALVANDPHLPLQVPNIWYRLSLEWRGDRGDRRRMTGASLPGLPFVAVGSNDHVAWGFTVAFDDRSDMVVVETDAAHPELYRTPAGLRPLDHLVEWIKVKGASDVHYEVTSTIWGPLVGRDSRGRPLAQQWQAHHPDGVNLTFEQMENAATVEQALDIANRSALPSYNMVVADDRGSIGWTVTGGLPRRIGFDGRVPSSWADGTHRWDGWLQPGDYPRVINPPSGRIWTANNRPVGRPLLDRLGLEGYITGPRARQVRDDLMARDRSTPHDSLQIQLDDRALFLGRWRAFLLEHVGDGARSGAPQRREFRRLVERGWDGRASPSSAGYLLVENFRFELARLVIGPLVPAGEQHALRPGVVIEWWESALWRLVHERPPHLLAPKWNDWDEVTLAAVDGTIAAVTAGGRPLASATWGSTTGAVRHPLSRALPWLARWLDMPFAPLPGDANMPRVRMPGPAGEVSATLRMAVSPGHEAAGIFHMPAGESGHPLSPHYRDMQRDWVEGRATPFLPGPTVQTLTLLNPRAPGGAGPRAGLK